MWNDVKMLKFLWKIKNMIFYKCENVKKSKKTRTRYDASLTKIWDLSHDRDLNVSHDRSKSKINNALTKDFFLVISSV